MQKKLIDIRYPKEIDDESIEDTLEGRSNSSSGGISFFTPKKIFLVVLPILVVPVMVLHFFFAQAEVTVWPHVTELHIEEQIIAQVDQDRVSIEGKIIPARLFEQEKEATKSFAATGKDEREEKAKGVIRVFNDNSADAQTLVVGTRFISEDGKLFRSVERVSIPGITNGNPGFLDVQVVAAESGLDYNIGPSNFSLPGLAGSALYTKVYGKSSEAMKGGAVGEVSVVTEGDIISAKEQLLNELEIEAKKTLFSRIPANFMIMEDSVETEVLSDNSLVQAGAALDEFTYTANIKIQVLAFAKDDGDLLSRNIFNSYLDPSEVVRDGTFQVAYTVEASNAETGRMVLGADISAQQYAQVDLTSIKSRLRGASQGEIGGILSEFPTLKKLEFSLWPFWVQNLPKTPDGLTMEISL